MQLLILSLVIVGAMGAPVVLTPSGLAFQSSAGGIPALFTSGQLVQAPATFAQDTSAAESLSLSNPNNPTTDVVLHSGFPFVAASLAPQQSASSAQSSQISQFSSPLTLSAPVTRVGINTVSNGVQSAHLASLQAPAQPQASSLVQPQQLTFTTLQSSNSGLPTILVPAQQAQQQPQQQVASQGFRTIPLTLAGPFQAVSV